MSALMAGAFSFAQLFGYLAFALGIAAFWQRDDRRLRYLVMALSLAYTVHFTLLGNPTAAASSLISALRSWLSLRTRSVRVALAIVAVNIAVGSMLVTEWRHILPIVGAVVGTLAMFLLKGIRLRLALLCGTCLWLTNNVLSGSIGGSALEAMIGLTNGVTIVRMLIVRHREKATAASL
ncbi:YgjV family protein [Niveibacterium terrae]|uniref:YgjV family protein n=1 Tax=Niveibacterium terrae TaxID=3373598 RepID=UPI003A8D27E6